MRRILIMIFILLLSGLCWSYTFLNDQPKVTPTGTPPPPTSTVISPSSTSTLTPTSTQTVVPKLTATIAPLPTTGSYNVLYHPDDVLYVGDQVSLEVISPSGSSIKDASLQVQVDPPGGPILGPVNFTTWGIQGRDEATLLWEWDTTGQEPGTHTLSFSVLPQGYSWTEQVTLLPFEQMPPSQADATWASTQTQCCTVFYITNTASERDLSSLTNLIDEQANLSIEEMGANFTEPITITILPRLLGHGGFASNDISVSYLDRNYAANSWQMVVHHEMIHSIDSHLGGDFRPNIFVEGLAVYLAGGHYKQEPFMPRAAALLEGYLNGYIPLKILTDDFYASQHEIGYLEGASLIEYMVNTYGWEEFSSFYRDIHINQGESQSDAIDKALQSHFSISFAQLEQDFRAALSQESDTSAWVDDVRFSVIYYDTLRRYQQLMDPSAYFRTAWLMDNQAMRQRSIVADYLRPPHTPQNLALETLLITASQQISNAHYSDASETLDSINAVLNGIEQEFPDPFSVTKLSADYFSISAILQELGYEVQRIEIIENDASVYASNSTQPGVLQLHLRLSGGEWILSP